MTDLPTRIRAYLSACPPAVSGQGGHGRTFSVACTLVNGFALDEHQALGFLSEWNTRCLPPWSEGELRHKIQGALSTTHSKPRGHLLGDEGWKQAKGIQVVPRPAVVKKSRWPELNRAHVELCEQIDIGVADLWENSPMRPPESPDPDFFIDQMFPGNPLICCGESSERFATKSREEWRGKLRKQQFIVPSPMSKAVGVTKDGKKSQHCLDNTGPRRFIVVEFDDGTTDLQAAKLWFLSKYAPMVLCVLSGSKSVHGWFWCDRGHPTDIVKFFRHAVSCGADEHLWVRSQFVRMPDGRRANGNDQSVVYFNPEAMA